jgi:hypothetical protein
MSIDITSSSKIDFARVLMRMVLAGQREEGKEVKRLVVMMTNLERFSDFIRSRLLRCYCEFSSLLCDGIGRKRMANWFPVNLQDGCARILCPYFVVLLTANESKLHLLLRRSSLSGSMRPSQLQFEF